MTCTHCGGTTADGIYLDDPCEAALWNILGVIPDTLADAQDTVARLDSKRGTGRGRPSTAPANLEAMQRVTELGELLVSWSRLVYEVTAEPGDAGADYLRRQLRAIVGHDWAGDMLAELDKAHRRVVACVDVPPEVRTYGTCNADGCAGTIRGFKGSRAARCSECRGVYDARELAAWAVSEAWHQRAPLPTVVRALTEAGFPVKIKTAEKWVERGKLETPWVNERGVRLYTMAQVDEVRRAGRRNLPAA